MNHIRSTATGDQRGELATHRDSFLGQHRHPGGQVVGHSGSGLLGVVTSGSAKFGPMSTLMAIEETARRRRMPPLSRCRSRPATRSH